MIDENTARALQKFRYERATEDAFSVISYDRLRELSWAVSNFLTVMNTEDRAVLILLRNCPAFPQILLGAAKSGFPYVVADSRITEQDLHRLLEKHKPGVVIMNGAECSRLSGTLTLYGCKNAVFVGQMPKESVFPAQFSYETLVSENDFEKISNLSGNYTSPVLFYGGENVKFPLDFDEIPTRTGVYVTVPFFETFGMQILLALINGGHRLVFPEELSKAYFKKHNIGVIICPACDKGKFEGLPVRIIPIENFEGCPYEYCGGGLLFSDAVSGIFTSRTGDKTAVSWDGAKLRIAVENEPRVTTMPLQKKLACDLLYPNVCPKSFVYRKPKG